MPLKERGVGRERKVVESGSPRRNGWRLWAAWDEKVRDDGRRRGRGLEAGNRGDRAWGADAADIKWGNQSAGETGHVDRDQRGKEGDWEEEKWDWEVKKEGFGRLSRKR